ncbi:MAG: hypothetical protein ACREAC_12225, partial [Blastocatellia bacterium]
HSLAGFFCVITVYSVGVVLATFLDDFFQMLASCLALIVFIVIVNRVSLPPSFGAFLILTRASPLITHTMPWIPMVTLLALSTMLLLVSVRIVRSREY